MRKKKIIGLLVFTMLVSMFTPGTFDVEASSLFAGGSGTAQDPYLIATAEHLYNIREASGQEFRLIADIDLQHLYDLGLEDWDPIPQFSGSIDGSGHTIYNLKINRPNSTNVGFIANVPARVTIKNLTFDGVDITGYQTIGTLFANTDTWSRSYVSEIDNVKVLNGSISVGSNGSTIGGLIGRTEYANIRNVLVENIEINASDSAYSIGGVVGSTPLDGYSDVFEYYNVHARNVNITAPKTYTRVGGLMGNPGYKIDIRYSSFDGNIQGGGYTGGLVGYDTQGVRIFDSYAKGKITEAVTAAGIVGLGDTVGGQKVRGISIRKSYANFELLQGSQMAAGLARNTSGTSRYSLLIEDSYSDSILKSSGNIYGIGNENIRLNRVYSSSTSSSPMYGLTGVATDSDIALFNKDIIVAHPSEPNTTRGKTTTAMKNFLVYSGWDFENIWYLDQGNDFPRLRALMPVILPSQPKVSETIIYQNNLVNVKFEWEEVEGADRYIIEKNGTELDVIQAGQANYTYTDTDITYSMTYEYKFFAENEAGLSQPAIITVTTKDEIRVTVISKSENTVTIEWNDVQAISYTIVRDGQEINTVTELSFIDSGLSPNKTYMYEVIANY